MTSHSYLDIMTELKEAVTDDECMPENVKDDVIYQIDMLFDTLWKYSD